MTDHRRDAPAYQDYAAARLADRAWRLWGAGTRGVFYSMRLEAWVNRTMPAEPVALAKILGLDAGDVAEALPAVMPFFQCAGEEISCPELDAYRTHLETRHLKLSEGGSRGAALTNSSKKKRRKLKNGVDQGIADDAATPAATPTACPTATPAASPRPLNTVQHNTTQSNSPSVKEVLPDPFVSDYAEAERATCTADAYRRASRGQ